jgi:hypothetical protein
MKRERFFAHKEEHEDTGKERITPHLASKNKVKKQGEFTLIPGKERSLFNYILEFYILATEQDFQMFGKERTISDAEFNSSPHWLSYRSNKKNADTLYQCIKDFLREIAVTDRALFSPLSLTYLPPTGMKYIESDEVKNAIMHLVGPVSDAILRADDRNLQASLQQAMAESANMYEEQAAEKSTTQENKEVLEMQRESGDRNLQASLQQATTESAKIYKEQAAEKSTTQGNEENKFFKLNDKGEIEIIPEREVDLIEYTINFYLKASDQEHAFLGQKGPISDEEFYISPWVWYQSNFLSLGDCINIFLGNLIKKDTGENLQDEEQILKSCKNVFEGVLVVDEAIEQEERAAAEKFFRLNKEGEFEVIPERKKNLRKLTKAFIEKEWPGFLEGENDYDQPPFELLGYTKYKRFEIGDTLKKFITDKLFKDCNIPHESNEDLDHSTVVIELMRQIMKPIVKSHKGNLMGKARASRMGGFIRLKENGEFEIVPGKEEELRRHLELEINHKWPGFLEGKEDYDHPPFILKKGKKNYTPHSHIISSLARIAITDCNIETNMKENEYFRLHKGDIVEKVLHPIIAKHNEASNLKKQQNDVAAEEIPTWNEKITALPISPDGGQPEKPLSSTANVSCSEGALVANAKEVSEKQQKNVKHQRNSSCCCVIG